MVYFQSFLDYIRWLIFISPKVFLWIFTSSCGVPLDNIKSPYGFSCDSQCVNALTSNVARFKYMIRYQLLVKALISLKQIMANHTFYFRPLSYMHGHARSLLPISHYTLICPRLYSLPSVCSDMIVFHTDRKDTDLIRGNQTQVVNRWMVGKSSIKILHWSAIETNSHPSFTLCCGLTRDIILHLFRSFQAHFQAFLLPFYVHNIP